MTLHIIHSNRVERLHDELCHLLQANPLANPFQKETIVCPSQAMARWINIRFTQKMGIAAHYDYPLPSSWVWQLANELIDDVPNQDPLQRDVMAWQIFHLLDELKENQSFESVKSYLTLDSNDTKRWSLAKKIAIVFERYQHFRPELINEWNNARAKDWQGELWQQLKQSVSTDRVQLLEKLGRILDSIKTTEQLPSRIVFFSVSALSTLLFKNIQALAKNTEVYFFVLSPSAHYWSDFISLKSQAHKRLNQPELSDYYTTGHALLASWGRQGQVFQDMLLNEIDDENTQQYDVYQEQFNATLLQQLQGSLFDLNDNIKVVNHDPSMRINRCHSPLRECEVLHDQLLELLENKNLTPEDILVIVPNMEKYATSIEVVFKKTSDQNSIKPFIPWNVSDTSLQSENALVKAFLDLFAMPSSRFNVSQIMTFLECPEILKRFGLEESDKPVIREYCLEGCINWGFDATHKAEFNVPEMQHNTWQQAQNRFFTAYAIDTEEPIDDIQPLEGFSSSRGLIIAQFIHLLNRLNQWRSKLSYARTMAQWQRDLNACIETFFTELKDQASLQSIRDALDELVLQSHELNKPQQAEIHHDLIQHYLNDYFSNAQHSQRFFTGGVTFCGMRPMRSVPFKVIVMLGMNEHEFPRQNKPIEFDLMAKQWKPGDLLNSDEDRYLFLEAILCARETLIMSYSAFSLTDNAEKQPSNLVSELCDYLDEQFEWQGNEQNKLTTAIVQDFAMHAFSFKNYQAAQENNYQSYNQYWLEIAQKINAEPVKEQLAQRQENQQEFAQEIDLRRFIQCLKDPIKWYYQSHLTIRLYDDLHIEDDEPFDLDGLQQWQIKNDLINRTMNQQNTSYRQIQAQGVLPHGNQSRHQYVELSEQVDEIMSGLSAYQTQQATTVAINYDLNSDITLTGSVNHYYTGLGLLAVTASKFSAKPLMDIWVKHCLLCVSKQLASDENSVLRCKDLHLTFEPLTIEEAQCELDNLLICWQHSQQQPIKLLPKTSFTYQLELAKSDHDKALIKALAQWNGSQGSHGDFQGEKDEHYVHLALNAYADNGTALINDDDFKDLAKQFYESAIHHAVTVDLTR